MSKMVDMSMTSKEQAEYINPSVPSYPYGLCISLCQDELEKLDLNDVEVGDVYHLHAIAKVTSTSANENSSGSTRRVELQLQYMSVPESEDEENEKAEMTSPTKRISKLYK